MELKQGYLIRLFEHDRLAFRHFIRNLLKKRGAGTNGYCMTLDSLLGECTLVYHKKPWSGRHIKVGRREANKTGCFPSWHYSTENGYSTIPDSLLVEGLLSARRDPRE